MKLTKEDRYIRRRLRQAENQAKEFYYNRKYPINPKKIVFTTIEGTTGFSCNPKYIALELLRRRQDLDLVWLVDDMAKEFPPGIRKVENTLQNRAYELATAAVWVDNSRKQLECRKRPGQFYLQTWHGTLGVKPIGFYREASFSRIAQLVSAHDSSMVDVMLSDSLWFDELIPRGMLYKGCILRYGMPRLDILINNEGSRSRIREQYRLPFDAKIIMYAPTFRGGSQGTSRSVSKLAHMPDYDRLIKMLEQRFGGKWYIFLRLHPQLTARHIDVETQDERIIDVSKVDDMYEVLAGCDAFLTDYSSSGFDAALMRIPVFVYADDYKEYVAERGELLWAISDVPFPWTEDDDELSKAVLEFDEIKYRADVDRMFKTVEDVNDGRASERVADLLEDVLAGGGGWQ